MKQLSEYRYYCGVDKNGKKTVLLLSPFEVALSQQRVNEYPEVQTWTPDGPTLSVRTWSPDPDPWDPPQPGPTLSNPPRLDPLRIGGVFACVVVCLFLMVTCG